MSERLNKVLLACGIVGPVLFVITFLIEGLTRSSYSPFRYPVSSLALGPQGWIQIANFLMVGLSLIACCVGLLCTVHKSKIAIIAALFVGVAGLGFMGAGIFVTDSVFGYPASAPLALAQFSQHGKLHDQFSVWVFRGIPFASFFMTYYFGRRRQKVAAIYSALTGIGMSVAVILAGLGFTQHQPLVSFAGVLQRTSITIGLAWVIWLAVRVKNNPVILDGSKT